MLHNVVTINIAGVKDVTDLVSMGHDSEPKSSFSIHVCSSITGMSSSGELTGGLN